MAITLDATVGGANANTYGTLTEANTYFTGAIVKSIADWTAASDDVKNRALAQATRRIDEEGLRGLMAATTQALQFPRSGTVDGDGVLVLNTVIHQRLKNAQFELALAMLAEDLVSDTGLEGFESVTIGDLEVTPKSGFRAGRLPAVVRRLLRPWLLSQAGRVRVMKGS